MAGLIGALAGSGCWDFEPRNLVRKQNVGFNVARRQSRRSPIVEHQFEKGTKIEVREFAEFERPRMAVSVDPWVLSDRFHNFYNASGGTLE